VSRCLLFAREGRYRLLDWLAWAELEIDNIRAVLRRAMDATDAGLGIDLATGLIWYWVTRATTEGVRCLDALLARDTTPAAHPWAYFARGFLGVLQSDPAAALPALERGVTAARAADQPDPLAQSLAMASIAAHMAGDRDSSRRLLDEALVLAENVRDVGATLMTLQARALNGLIDHDLAAVRSAAAQGARLSREAGDLYSLQMMVMNQGLAILLSGNLRDAEQRFAEGLRIARQLDDRLAQCYLVGALGCCAAASREPRLAARLLGAMDNLRAQVGASINAGWAPALEQATTTVTTALGRSAFESEFTAGQRMGRDAAARLALREAAAPAVTAAEQDRSGILGRRETDVARLVADGLSNKQIGARLFISERTVESHVRNILNKLGFNSRAQIAGWMATPDG
jgi:DNA-binding CsgD family transcriptional regulator